MSKFFGDLRPFQKAEFLLMVFLAFAVPLSWLAAQYFEVALFVCALLKVIFDQRFKMNEGQMRFKWVYIVYALTWLVYLVGMIHTENQQEGWAQVSKKLGFLVFPLIFLFSDMSYLTKDRVRVICYAFVSGCVLFFLINLMPAIYDVVFKGADSSRFFDQQLMKYYYVHHSYMSMYVTFAMVFCVVEILKQDSLKLKITDSVVAIMMMVFVFLLDSRAGLLFMFLEIIALWIWITFVEKKKKFGMISMGTLVFILVLVGVVAPNVYSRVAVTIKNLTAEDRTDRRVVQLRGSLSACEENWLFGVGSGDRSEAIMASFLRYREKLVEEIVPVEGADRHEFEQGRTVVLQKIMELSDYDGWNEMNKKTFRFIEEKSAEYKCDAESVRRVASEYIYISNAIYHELNTHNQYIDTMISAGVVGLLLLLAYFLIPLVFCIRTRRFDMVFFSFLFLVGFNALFESVFEVQKGIIFFCFFNALLFYMSFRPNNSLELKV